MPKGVYIRKPKPKLACSECNRTQTCRGYCIRHYQQWRRCGHTLTEQEIKKNYAKKRGACLNTGRTHFKKGHKAWSKGLKGWLSDAHLEALRKANTGHTPWNKGKKWPEMAGPNNPAWKGGVKSQNDIDRARFRTTVQALVLKRDDFTCQICKERGGFLQVDHIKKWSEYPEHRFDLDNCRTLCMGCHYKLTFNREMPEGIIWGHGLDRRIRQFQRV